MDNLEFKNTPKWQTRSALMFGEDKLKKLKEKNVLVVGVGGVGGYAAELICRAGVGKMTIIDGDDVETTNRNRQLLALKSTEGVSKVEVMKQRLLDINPELDLTAKHIFVKDKLTDEILEEKFDYVVDAIDSLSPKLNLIIKTKECNYPIISSMGAGGKLDPTKVEVADISKSYNCKLAKAIRKRLHRRGIRKGIKVIFSPEDIDPNAVFAYETEDGTNKSMVGTISYMPAVFGCNCASVVIRDLLNS
ncbi:tRNA threonylcarbamoyladenosine dehydratase [Lentisphaerota bacterium WC36G]|nr:tRNA threonylcarbamoyladenosine dehydratase [Lentisphaerae bacterium WC36]